MNSNKDPITGKYIGILWKADKKIIIKKIEDGITIKEIAKSLNVTATGLRNFLIKNNIQYKKRIKYSSNSIFFDDDNEYSFYWAGFIAADGCISKKSDFALSLKLSDFNHIEKFKKITSATAPIKILPPRKKIINKVETQTSGTALIRFRNVNWINSLSRFNIIPNKTKTFDIPDSIIKSNLFNHFLRGYFDGDGWFSSVKQNNDKIKINWGICGNFSVLEKIKNNIAKNCDIEGKPYFAKQKNIYRLSYQKQHDVSKIVDYLYNNASIYLDRKYELAQMSKKLDAQTIFLHLDKNKLKESYQRLKSYSLVAKEFDCAKSSIAKYISKYKISKE